MQAHRQAVARPCRFLALQVDISSVVVDHMRAQHDGVPGLTYLVGDCRDMRQFAPCSFAGALGETACADSGAAMRSAA